MKTKEIWLIFLNENSIHNSYIILLLELTKESSGINGLKKSNSGWHATNLNDDKTEPVITGTDLRSGVSCGEQSWWSWDSFQSICKKFWCLSWFKSVARPIWKCVNQASLDQFWLKSQPHNLSALTASTTAVSFLSKTMQQNSYSKRNTEIFLHLF